MVIYYSANSNLTLVQKNIAFNICFANLLSKMELREQSK